MNLEEDFEDLKDNLEGLSLQEKKIKLEEFQSEVEDEILSLQTISSEVDDMLGNVLDELGVVFKNEIQAALEEIVSASQNEFMVLEESTLDIEGLRFIFKRFALEDKYLRVYVKEKIYSYRTRDFQIDIDKFIREIFPEATLRDCEVTFTLKNSDDISTMIKYIVTTLLSVRDKIKELAVEYKSV